MDNQKQISYCFIKNLYQNLSNKKNEFIDFFLNLIEQDINKLYGKKTNEHDSQYRFTLFFEYIKKCGQSIDDLYTLFEEFWEVTNQDIREIFSIYCYTLDNYLDYYKTLDIKCKNSEIEEIISKNEKLSQFRLLIVLSIFLKTVLNDRENFIYVIENFDVHFSKKLNLKLTRSTMKNIYDFLNKRYFKDSNIDDINDDFQFLINVNITNVEYININITLKNFEKKFSKFKKLQEITQNGHYKYNIIGAINALINSIKRMEGLNNAHTFLSLIEIFINSIMMDSNNNVYDETELINEWCRLSPKLQYQICFDINNFRIDNININARFYLLYIVFDFWKIFKKEKYEKHMEMYNEIMRINNGTLFKNNINITSIIQQFEKWICEQKNNNKSKNVDEVFELLNSFCEEYDIDEYVNYYNNKLFDQIC